MFKSLQALFEHAVTHMLVQGEKSITDHLSSVSQCRYRYVKEDGKKLMCAVGACIPDNLYNPELEGNGSTSHKITMIMKSVCEFKYDQLADYTMSRLQNLHDNFPVTAWIERAKAIGKEHSLDISFIDRVESPLLPKSTEV